MEDQEIEAVEPGDGRLESGFAACDLQLLDEVGRPGEEHLVARLDERQADCGSEMGLA